MNVRFEIRPSPLAGWPRRLPAGGAKRAPRPRITQEITSETKRCAQADAQVRAVGDGADDLRRKGIAEEVNAEEIERDGGGADRRGNRVHDGGVQRPGVEEEEELGGEERRNRPGTRAEEDAECRRAE